MEAMGAWEAALSAINTGTGILTVFESFDATLNASAPHTAGRWTAVSYNAMSNTTTLTQDDGDPGDLIPSFAAGWRVQIDANLAYAFPVLAVSGDSIAVPGDMTGLASIDGVYALISPAHIDSATGAVQTDPLARESRYLFAGYRHLPAVAGFYVDPDGPGGLPLGVYGTQPGGNLSGDYHCGDRVYSTYQGRFTTPRWGRRAWIQLFGDNNSLDPNAVAPPVMPSPPHEPPPVPYPEDPPANPPELPVPLPPAEVEKRVCGPDVTEWFEEELAIHQRVWDNYPSISPAWLFFGAVVTGQHALLAGNTLLRMKAIAEVGPTIGYKWLSFSSDDCPINCPNTVTLYGKCVHDSELGNIVFGMIAHILYPDDKFILWGAMKYGGSDKEEDVAGVIAGMFIQRARKGWGIAKGMSTRTLLSSKRPTHAYLKKLYGGAWINSSIRKYTSKLYYAELSFLSVMHEAPQSYNCKPCPSKLSSSAKHIEYPSGDPTSTKKMYEDLEGPGITPQAKFPKD